MSDKNQEKATQPTPLARVLDKLKEAIELQKEEDQILLRNWIRDWKNYINFRNKFDPKRNITYKAGYIAEVNFGQNVGSEQGGVRPAVVIEDNMRSSPVVTVIPLSSLKEAVSIKDVEDKGNVFLGELSEYNTTFKKEKGTESIALMGQIRAVSKMRVRFPVNQKDQIVKLNPDLLKKIYSALTLRYATAGLTEETKIDEKGEKTVIFAEKP